MDNDTLSKFTAITSTTNESAQQYLNLTDGNLEQALELYFASDGADLEPVSSTNPAHAVQVPPTSTGPSRRQQGYEDESGVVHVDSESGSEDLGDESSQQPLGTRVRSQADINAPSAVQTPIATAASTGRAGPVEDDESMARRLQEEIYSATGTGDVVDSEGIRAPIARTTETLVGPGAYGGNDEGDMHAAVMEQMRTRSQPRGHSPSRVR